jgi:hypothetical protein
MPEPVQLLVELLTQRLPRSQRCGVCRYWQRDDDNGEGECVQGVPGRATLTGNHCGPHDGCNEWFSRLPQPAYYDSDFENDLDGEGCEVPA